LKQAQTDRKTHFQAGRLVTESIMSDNEEKDGLNFIDLNKSNKNNSLQKAIYACKDAKLPG